VSWQCPWCFFVADEEHTVTTPMQGCEKRPRSQWGVK